MTAWLNPKNDRCPLCRYEAGAMDIIIFSWSTFSLPKPQAPFRAYLLWTANYLAGSTPEKKPYLYSFLRHTAYRSDTSMKTSRAPDLFWKLLVKLLSWFESAPLPSILVKLYPSENTIRFCCIGGPFRQFLYDANHTCICNWTKGSISQLRIY